MIIEHSITSFSASGIRVGSADNAGLFYYSNNLEKKCVGYQTNTLSENPMIDAIGVLF